jgi:hypothetical protein
VLVVALADLLSDHASARWRSGGHTRAIKELASLDALLETPYGLRVGHPAIARYRRSGADASKLIEYIEAVGRILNETHQGRASDRAAPIKGGSRLFPSRFRSDWYS